MGIIKYNPDESRFNKLNPKPLPLIKSISKGDFIRTTKGLVYDCLCPISENSILIHENGNVGCDVNLEGKTHCKVIGLEYNICPYRDNIK